MASCFESCRSPDVRFAEESATQVRQSLVKRETCSGEVRETAKVVLTQSGVDMYMSRVG